MEDPTDNTNIQQPSSEGQQTAPVVHSRDGNEPSAPGSYRIISIAYDLSNRYSLLI